MPYNKETKPSSGCHISTENQPVLMQENPKLIKKKKWHNNLIQPMQQS